MKYSCPTVVNLLSIVIRIINRIISSLNHTNHIAFYAFEYLIFTEKQSFPKKLDFCIEYTHHLQFKTAANASHCVIFMIQINFVVVLFLRTFAFLVAACRSNLGCQSFKSNQYITNYFEEAPTNLQQFQRRGLSFLSI